MKGLAHRKLHTAPLPYYTNALPRFKLAAERPLSSDTSLHANCYRLLVSNDNTLHSTFQKQLHDVIPLAFQNHDTKALTQVHKTLFLLHDLHWIHPHSPMHKHADWASSAKRKIENTWLHSLKAELEEQLPPTELLSNGETFKKWAHKKATEASPIDTKLLAFYREKMRRSDLQQLVLSDGYISSVFYDITAMLAAQPHCKHTKKALSDQVYEEGGSGKKTEAHTEQFSQTLKELGIAGLPLVPSWDWRGYAGFNLFVTLCSNRSTYYYGLGFFGMGEKTDSARNEAIIAGIKRLGLNPDKFGYHQGHAVLDADHGDEAIQLHVDVIAEHKGHSAIEVAKELALGILMYQHSSHLYKGFLAENLQGMTLSTGQVLQPAKGFVNRLYEEKIRPHTYNEALATPA